MARLEDRYVRIIKEGRFSLKERRSEFIATAVPADTVEEAKEAIESISKKYSDARHNCWAYRVGFPKTTEHCSDDGEPSGSAGRPILGAVVKADLYDLAIVVTRYFGGVKLGVRGLIDAYSASAQGVLETCPREERTVTEPLGFTVGYEGYGDCLHHLTALGIPEENVAPSFGEKVSVKVEIPISLLGRAEETMEDLRLRGIIEGWESL
ncbi:YigZ family protein [Dethiosulfovibrio sp. F2B]|uniref:IMPACT family protein n=1 Tax=Dethiosulfovibrio faecalis TaxID=2720018 RepID=UPI001F3744A0|nr:YigZ family protein [Dethiosulfovibrio faecalis]MCF4151006.1 YigZ family protein [Dethiosulfovibrio faecalis]